MPKIDYIDLGKTLALSELGVPVNEHSYFTSDTLDSYERSRLAINFCKEASFVVAPFGKEGLFASILLNKIASIPAESIDPTVVDVVLDHAIQLNEISKTAGVLGSTALATTNYVPSLIKSFIALAALTGAGGGAAAWAGKHALQGPDEDEIAKLEAGVQEYHKLRGRVAREKENDKIEAKYL